MDRFSLDDIDKLAEELATNVGNLEIRDYFAGQALAGMFADSHLSGTHENLAKACYSMADAMLAERNKSDG